MNIDQIFKIPAIPSGKNKRKLHANPDQDFLDKYRELNATPEQAESSSSGGKSKRRNVTIEDEEDGADGGVEYMGYDEEEDEGRFYGGGLTEEQQQIMDLMDEVDEEEPEAMDLTGVKRMILRFEKTINKNQELRMKFADDPTKFMESEADLDEEIKHLFTLAQVPHLYPDVVKLGTIPSLLSLLSHENTDIAIDAIELLNELTDEDVGAAAADNEEDEDAAQEGVRVLVDALLENQMLELLIQNLSRMDENEPADKQGVFNTLGIMENLTGLDPKLSERIVAETELLPWLLKRIKVKAFDSNKQYASEIVSILLQSSRANRIKFGELGGVDVLLQMLSGFKRKDPRDADETEMVENFFDALCSALAEPEIKQRFLDGEGVELMLIMMKEKMMSRMRSIKVLDFALSTPEGAPCCIRFVDVFGLKTLFSTFMRKGVKKLKKTYKGYSDAEEEEHIICIIVSLLKNLPTDTIHRFRLINKFSEDDYEKSDRLLEIREQYDARVEAVDREVRAAQRDDDELEETEEELYLKRLEAGLFTLQMVDLTIAWVCDEDKKVKDHIRLLMNRKGQDFEGIKKVLKEYANSLGNDAAETTEEDARPSLSAADENGDAMMGTEDVAVVAKEGDTVVASESDTVVASESDTVVASESDTVVASEGDTVMVREDNTVMAREGDTVMSTENDEQSEAKDEDTEAIAWERAKRERERVFELAGRL